MRIAFTGVHSTGKTTLLDALKSNYSEELYAISEIARNVISCGYPLGKDANVDSYINLISEQLKAENIFVNYGRDKLIIADRTLLDTLAYAKVNKGLPRPYIPEYFIDMLEQIWLIEKNFYDLYIYFPIEFEMKNDDVRPLGEDYRASVNDQIKRLLDKFSVKYLVITGSVDNRLQQILEVIENKVKYSK